MKIHLIKQRASREQMIEMLESLKSYVKLAVDVEQRVLAGGGSLHADCEAELIGEGALQENIWGADWFPHSQQVTYESLINIRPSQNNFALEIEDEKLKTRIKDISEALLKGVEYE